MCLHTGAVVSTTPRRHWCGHCPILHNLAQHCIVVVLITCDVFPCPFVPRLLCSRNLWSVPWTLHLVFPLLVWTSEQRRWSPRYMAHAPPCTCCNHSLRAPQPFEGFIG